MSNEKKPIQFYIDQERGDKLRQIAAHYERSVAAQLRRLVNKEIERGIRDGIIHK